jgi:hypothetical protein
MASYFVTTAPLPDGAHTIHNRSRCPPGTFPLEAGAAEYLGDFLHAAQAAAVARLRYARVRTCACCQPVDVQAARSPAVRPLAPALLVPPPAAPPQ